MIGDTLMQGLIVFYVLVAIVFDWEGNYAKCAYWKDSYYDVAVRNMHSAIAERQQGMMAL